MLYKWRINLFSISSFLRYTYILYVNIIFIYNCNICVCIILFLDYLLQKLWSITYINAYKCVLCALFLQIHFSSLCCILIHVFRYLFCVSLAGIWIFITCGGRIQDEIYDVLLTNPSREVAWRRIVYLRMHTRSIGRQNKNKIYFAKAW